MRDVVVATALIRGLSLRRPVGLPRSSIPTTALSSRCRSTITTSRPTLVLPSFGATGLALLIPVA